MKSKLDNDLDNYEYYFEVWDNDAVNGKKSSKSKVFAMSTPSQEELRADAENGHKALKKSMQNTLTLDFPRTDILVHFQSREIQFAYLTVN